MASFRLISAPTHAQIARLLNGLIVGKRDITLRGRDSRPNPDTTAGHDLFKHPVAGLTLIFTTPAATVTFSADLDWKEILAEITAVNAAIGPNIVKTDPNGGGVLAFWNDTTPVVMAHTGTANSYFGFSTTMADPALTQNPTPNTAVHSIIPDPLSKQWVAFIYE